MTQGYSLNINGTVEDENGYILPYVKVGVYLNNSLNQNLTTDENGEFQSTLMVAEGTYNVQIKANSDGYVGESDIVVTKVRRILG